MYNNIGFDVCSIISILLLQNGESVMEEVATGGKSEENVSCFCEQVQTLAVSFVCCRFCETY